jgi:hypothetical protein
LFWIKKISDSGWVPPAKLFGKLSRRALDKQLVFIQDIETVSGFSHGSWISGIRLNILLVFPGRNKVKFTG